MGYLGRRTDLWGVSFHRKVTREKTEQGEKEKEGETQRGEKIPGQRGKGLEAEETLTSR